jgi:hypothetical protein
VARCFHTVTRPEQPRQFVAWDFATGLRAEVERESELQVGLGREADASGMDLSLAEYSAADG